jgi:hypothetical protein
MRDVCRLRNVMERHLPLQHESLVARTLNFSARTPTHHSTDEIIELERIANGVLVMARNVSFARLAQPSLFAVTRRHACPGVRRLQRARERRFFVALCLAMTASRLSTTLQLEDPV